MTLPTYPWLVVVLISWEYFDDPGEEFRRYFAGEGNSRRAAELDAKKVAEDYVIGDEAVVTVGRTRVVRRPRSR